MPHDQITPKTITSAEEQTSDVSTDAPANKLDRLGRNGVESIGNVDST